MKILYYTQIKTIIYEFLRNNMPDLEILKIHEE